MAHLCIGAIAFLCICANAHDLGCVVALCEYANAQSCKCTMAHMWVCGLTQLRKAIIAVM